MTDRVLQVLSGVAAAFLANVAVASPVDLVSYVDPMIGAVTYADGRQDDIHGFGKTFPGAATPFGMVQLSPDTVTGGDNGSGYSYSHNTIEGFSFLHMSAWYVLAAIGRLPLDPAAGVWHSITPIFDKVRLKTSESPALKLRFVPFDASLAGRRGR